MLSKNLIKKILIAGILLTQATGFFYDNISHAWSYPLKQVSKLSCKKIAWDIMPEECKQTLPRIENANYAKYKDNTDYTYIYSTLWGASYNLGWDYGLGSHEGVDIATAEGTPVYAMGAGVVTKAGAQAGYGNVVMIKHTLNDGKNIFSIYAHLKSVDTTVGKSVKEGELIGKVGNVGFSFGNHLLWAINITPTNSYAFYGCPELGLGTTFGQLANVVNNGLCREYLTSRTLDPIAFIEAGGDLQATQILTNKLLAQVNTPIKPTAPTNTKPTETTKPSTPTKPNTVVVTKPVASDKPIDTTKPSTPDNLVYAPQVSYEFDTTVLKNKDSFFKDYTLHITSNFGDTIKNGSTSILGVTIKDKNGNTFKGILPKELSFIQSKNILTISPRNIRNMSAGETLALVYAKEKGTTDIVVSYGSLVIGKISVIVK